MQNHSRRMRRLVTAGLLPERAGQPVKAVVHISLADLMRLGGSSALLQEWTVRVRAQWAGHRARASQGGGGGGGGGGGAWLDGDAAEAVACDAAMVPFVTGDVDPGALEDLVRLCVQLDRLRHDPRGGAVGPDGDGPGASGDGAGTTGPGTGGGQDSTGCGPAAAAPDTARAWEALERAIIGKAVDLLSGPGGLASFLRRRQLGARLGGPSLPLDIGFSQSIPAGIRNAVTLQGPALPVGRTVRPARLRLRSPPRQAQEERRHHQHQRLRTAVLLPPPDRHPQVGLDPRPEPRRDHDRVEPGQNQGLS